MYSALCGASMCPPCTLTLLLSPITSEQEQRTHDRNTRTNERRQTAREGHGLATQAGSKNGRYFPPPTHAPTLPSSHPPHRPPHQLPTYPVSPRRVSGAPEALYALHYIHSCIHALTHEQTHSLTMDNSLETRHAISGRGWCGVRTQQRTITPRGARNRRHTETTTKNEEKRYPPHTRTRAHVHQLPQRHLADESCTHPLTPDTCGHPIPPEHASGFRSSSGRRKPPAFVLHVGALLPSSRAREVAG